MQARVIRRDSLRPVTAGILNDGAIRLGQGCQRMEGRVGELHRWPTAFAPERFGSTGILGDSSWWLRSLGVSSNRHRGALGSWEW